MERRAAGQAAFLVGGDADQGLEQGIVAEGLGVVAVGLAGENLVDLLGQEGFAAGGDEFLGAGIGKALGDVGQDAEFMVEQADGQEAGIGDDATALEIEGDLLPADVPKGKLV
jgi:hypothetical protein